MSDIVDRITAVLRESAGPLFPHGADADEWAAHVAERVAAELPDQDDLKERLEKAARTLDGMYQNALLRGLGISRLAGKAEGVRLALSYINEAERSAWSEGTP